MTRDHHHLNRRQGWKTYLGLGLALVTLLSAGVASGQEAQIKPYVMLLFDTSGSMRYRVCSSSNVGGDGSAECPGPDLSCSSCNSIGCGNGLPDDTRIYKVKKGASSVISAFGEVTFGLSRFHQDPISFNCNYGGWWGAPDSCDPGWGYPPDPMGTGSNRSDVLVGFSDNNQVQLLRWMNFCDDYPTPGACPWGVEPGDSGHPDTPSSGCNLCTECGGGCDMELRAEGYTPLAGSLYHLRNSFFPSVIAADPKKDCRPYKVIMLTDGQDNCPGSPVTEAQNLFQNPSKSIPVHVIGFADSSLQTTLNSIAGGGGTNTAVIVDDEVSLALAIAQIVSESLLKEVCNNADDDCDDLCDETFPEVAVTNPLCTNQRSAQTCTAGLGICKNTGQYVCKADESGVECSVSPLPGLPNEICDNNLDDNCNGQVDEGCLPCVPEPEICDGKDNNCNGQKDEGYVSVPCGSNIGACAAGTTSCENGQVICNGQTPSTTELCDNIDNNCDTVVDGISQACYPPSSGCDLATTVCLGTCKIGSELCTNGSWNACLGFQGPSPEVCNGLDDNCDGQIDEGAGNTCTDYSNCTNYVTCAACPPTPAESCDNVDNDCNGTVDDNVPGEGAPCGSGVGECTPGQRQCEAGQWNCVGGTGGSAEVCDGLDNDCNGAIDDNVPGEGDPCGSAVGECEPGQNKCQNGQWICTGGVGPQPEICDGKDNNCDGTADELAECPGESECVEGVCVLPCGVGEFVCPGGTECIDGYCMPGECDCTNTQNCVNGNCVEKCTGVVCEDYEKCELTTGQCVDDSCVTQGCPDGQICVAHQCVTDPCPPGTCPENQMCSEGKCYDVCTKDTCPSGQACVKGKCTPDPCAGYPCDENYTCKVNSSGQPNCEPDPCRLVSCPSGQVCVDGNCIADPCAATKCPKGFRCEVSSGGEASCSVDPASPYNTQQLLASGAGGCACRVPSDTGDLPGGEGVMLLFGLIWLVRRRRGSR
ncbi:MAG: MopE-related protein [Planctomycetota bacterium]|jgi:MYXO-CTERM domain-containing protein